MPHGLYRNLSPLDPYKSPVRRDTLSSLYRLSSCPVSCSSQGAELGFESRAERHQSQDPSVHLLCSGSWADPPVPPAMQCDMRKK